MTADEAREYGRRHGWADAIRRIVDDAPPPPAEAIEMLRRTGYPVRRRPDLECAS